MTDRPDERFEGRDADTDIVGEASADGPPGPTLEQPPVEAQPPEGGDVEDTESKGSDGTVDSQLYNQASGWKLRVMSSIPYLDASANGYATESVTRWHYGL